MKAFVMRRVGQVALVEKSLPPDPGPHDRPHLQIRSDRNAFHLMETEEDNIIKPLIDFT
jgi:hypothetical protein